MDLPFDFFHDPDFFTDPVDGTQYLYAGNGPDGRYVTIGSDMVTTSAIRHMKIDRTNVGHEANSVFYRDGHYYMMTSGGDIYYHMSSSATGPWSYTGVAMPLDGWVSNHTSTVEYKDAWLIFYHVHDPALSGVRTVGAEYMHFNEDGTIQTMKRTREGVYYGGSGNGTTVNDITTGTGQKQFNYVGSGWKSGATEAGCWNNDLHRSSTTGDYFDLDFTGIQVRLYAKKASGYGTAMVSIDGGPESRISFKDASTQNQALIYKSPWLKSGSHTLKVKVANGTISSDFVEILTTKPAPAPTPPSVRNVAIVKFDSDGPAKMKDNLVQVTASSEQHAVNTSAFKACDWTPTSRWASGEGDRQWISVDLGSSYTIDKVVLRWDVAFAKSYKIQASSDGTNWKDVYSTSKGNGGVDDISISETTSRYWRMYGTEQGSGHGYSLWDFEIWTSSWLIPLDGATDVSALTDLSWQPGVDLTDQTVYFGTDPCSLPVVASGDGTLETVSNAMLGGTLDPLTTYYWRMDGEDATETNSFPGTVWSFATEPSEVNNPRPADGEIDVTPSNSPILEWDGFGAAASYEVYLGTAPGSLVKVDTVVSETYPTSGLTELTWYYWQIVALDSVGNPIVTGPEWSFQTAAAIVMTSISVNFQGSTPIYAGDAAGLNLATNWNNAETVVLNGPDAGVLAAGTVIDSTGAVVSGMEITWNAGFGWTPYPPTSGTANDNLFHYGLIATEAVWPSTITVTNIPYAEYDVVVYQEGTWGTRGAEVSVVGHPDTYCSLPYHYPHGVDPQTGFDGRYILVTSTDPCNPTVDGNYSVHAGLTGATCTINWTPRTEGPEESQDEGWVVGFQIVTRKNHLFNPVPADGSTVYDSVNQLQWTLPEPNELGGLVTCDVYFGTNSWVGQPQYMIVDNLAVESVAIGPLIADTNYYWGMGVYDDSISTTVVYLYSNVFTFRAVDNFAPVVDANDDVETWLANGETERLVQLGGVLVEDDGVPGPATFEWTVTDEPNVLNPATFDDATLLNATVTVKLVGSYILQLEADDGDSTDTDIMQIELYADSCEHAQNQPGFGWLAGDVNRDCKVDFVDFANLAADWLEEHYSTE